MGKRANLRTAGALGAVLATALAAVTLVPAAHAQSGQPTVRPRLAAAAQRVGASPTVAGRVAALDQVAAMLPSETLAYGAPTLWNAGITGAGRTVAVVESFGDPNAAQVLDSYSQQHGLPPGQLSVIAPAGPIPVCTPQLDQQIGCTSWIGETDLDITMIHALAPAAHIVIAATPVNETEGFTGLPEMMEAIDYLVGHRLADAISLSFGTPEDDFPKLSDPATLDGAFRDARQAGIPVVASSGDCGPTDNTLTSASQCADVFPYRAVSWPASDPLVTAVGGTVLHLDATGNRTSPDTLWPASGAGLSKTYPRPSWQNRVAPIIGSRRALPDVAMKGVQGTSQAAPLFAAVLALASQLHGGPLGFVNPLLYRLGQHATTAGIVDVTVGDNSEFGVPGFTAGPGFDIASGWGTVDPPAFVPALAAAAAAD